MEKPACLFGAAFRREREKKGFSFWELVYRAAYYPANIKRIEQGTTQPSVQMAFRMLDAIAVEPGSFMASLAREHADKLPQSHSGMARVAVHYTVVPLRDAQKSLFGPLLAQARLAASVSQTAMAKATGYNLRNISMVEKGLQEPGVMTALGLVMTTGVDVEEFFRTLYIGSRKPPLPEREERWSAPRTVKSD